MTPYTLDLLLAEGCNAAEIAVAFDTTEATIHAYAAVPEPRPPSPFRQRKARLRAEQEARLDALCWLCDPEPCPTPAECGLGDMKD